MYRCASIALHVDDDSLWLVTSRVKSVLPASAATCANFCVKTLASRLCVCVCVRVCACVCVCVCVCVWRQCEWSTASDWYSFARSWYSTSSTRHSLSSAAYHRGIESHWLIDWLIAGRVVSSVSELIWLNVVNCLQRCWLLCRHCVECHSHTQTVCVSS